MELLGRSLIGPDFRKRVFNEPDSVPREYNLSPQDSAASKSIHKQTIEGAAGQIAERSEFAISIVIRGHFDMKS